MTPAPDIFISRGEATPFWQDEERVPRLLTPFWIIIAEPAQEPGHTNITFCDDRHCGSPEIVENRSPVDANSSFQVCWSFFEDSNGNSLWDENEALLAEVLLTLSNASEFVHAYITDGENDPYCFMLFPGDFVVAYRIPRDYIPSAAWRNKTAFRIIEGANADHYTTFVVGAIHQSDLPPVPIENNKRDLVAPTLIPAQKRGRMNGEKTYQR